jgi:Alginate export
MRRLSKLIYISLAFGSVSHVAIASELADAVTGGKVILDARLRFEGVNQANLLEDASALSSRVRFGYETASFQGLKLLAEGEGTWEMTSDVYNNSYDGQVTYPVVADPGQLELNRAQLSYTGIKDIGIIIGRQRINIDNQRFIGSVGWRQNEQTYDAAQLTYTGIKNAKLTYVYIDDVRRVFGRKSPVGRFASDSHIFNASYQLIPQLKITGYALLLDLQNKNGTATTVSTQTYGGRADGKYKAGVVDLTMSGEYATQKNYSNNPRLFSLDYYMLEGGAAAKGFSLTAGYEVLQGNGVQGFSTPLATLFAFNGWADAFLNTPAVGVRDLYLKAGYTREKVPALGTVRAQVHYHDYKRDFGVGTLGSEWNALFSVQPNKRITIEARYATYDGKGVIGFPNRDKIWLQMQFVK